MSFFVSKHSASFQGAAGMGLVDGRSLIERLSRENFFCVRNDADLEAATKLLEKQIGKDNYSILRARLDERIKQMRVVRLAGQKEKKEITEQIATQHSVEHAT